MDWTRYLPDSPDLLTRWEWRTWLVAGIFGVLAIVLGFVARDIGRHRGAIVQARLDKTIQERDQKADDLRKMATKAAEEVADAKSELAKAKQEVAEIQRRQQPRTLTAEQKKRFVEFLREGPQGGLYKLAAVYGDGEAQALVTDLQGLFRVAGWPVQNFTLALMSGRTPSGIALFVRSQETAPVYVTTIRRAFVQIGFQEPTVDVDPSVPTGGVFLLVGRRAP